MAAAEQYPFMQSPDWKQYHVLEAREALEKLPEDERPRAAAVGLGSGRTYEKPLSGSGRECGKPQALVERDLSLRKNFLKLKKVKPATK